MSTIPPVWPHFDLAENPLDALVKLSRFYGAYPAYTVADGGNTSCKEGDVLHVKASGRSLAGIGRDDFVAMDMRRLAKLAQAAPDEDAARDERRFLEALLAARLHADSARPSTECVLHALVPGRFVVHTHAVYANALACCEGGERLAKELFADDVLWIPYAPPGAALARMARRRLSALPAGKTVPTLLLQNHGLLVAGDTPQDVRGRTDRFMTTLRGRIGPMPSTPPTPAESSRRLRELAAALQVLLGAAAVAVDDSLASFGEPEGPLCVEEILHCGTRPLRLGAAEAMGEALSAYRRETGAMPRVILAEGLGVLTTGPTAAAAQATRDVFRSGLETAAVARRLGRPQPLTAAQQRFIETVWLDARRPGRAERT